METCANCGEKIGRLETPRHWKQHVVCAKCFKTLSESEPEPEPVYVPVSQRQAVPKAVQTERRCPHCGGTNVKTLRTAYMEGTKVGGFSGIGVGENSVTVFGGPTSSQTLAARFVAPPAKRRGNIPILLAVVFILLTAILGVGAVNLAASASKADNRGAVPMFVLAFICLAATILMVGIYLRNQRWNKTEWVALNTKWSRTWVCGQCGRKFV